MSDGLCLRLPLAVGCSIALGLSLHVLSTQFAIKTIRGPWVGLTCAVIMDMSAPERILVRAVFRAFGSVVGATLGVILALVYEKLGDCPEGCPPNATQRLFQLVAMISVALLCSVSVKLFADFAYAFLLILFTVAIALYPPSLQVAVEYMTSVCAGAGIATLTLAVFHYPSAAQTVLDCYWEVVMSCVDFVASSICESRSSPDVSIKQHHRLVHNLTHKLAAAHDALANYVRVHKFINSHKATVSHLNDLSVALRAVYHRAHTVYLTLSNAANADLFRDDQFCETFGYHVLRLKDTFLAIKDKLAAVHRRKRDFDAEKFAALAQDLELLTDIMYTLKGLFLKHQRGFLDEQNKHWSVLCLLITVGPVIAALNDYIIALGHFMAPYASNDLNAFVDTRLVKVRLRIEQYIVDADQKVASFTRTS